MDQSVEAVFATMIFVSALACSNSIIFGAYSSILSKESGSVKTDIAAIVANTIVTENSLSSERWIGWNPSSDPDLYGLPVNTKIWINACYLSVDEIGNLYLLDMKTSGERIYRLGNCEYDRLILLDDGNLVLLRVVAG